MLSSLLPRIVAKIELTPSGCWHWQGACSSRGYSSIWWEGRMRAGHRLVYELLVAPTPEGLVVDHLCRNRRCVNPQHLRPCTSSDNILAPGSLSPSKANAEKRQCIAGHDLPPYVPGSERDCAPCKRAREARARTAA